MNKDKRNKLILFLSFFLLYFILGIIFSEYFKTTELYNVFFGSDTKRVVEDLILRVGNHYRASVHPLFVILFQPIIKIIVLILRNKIISIITFQSLLNAGSICLIYSLNEKIKLNKIVNIVLTLIFGLSFANIFFSMTIETYIFAQFFLILLFYFTYLRKDKELSEKDFIILSILGIFSLGITITNYFVYGLVVIFLTLLNPSMKNKKIKSFILCIIFPIIISVFLSEVQSIIFPNTPLYLIENVKGFLMGSSEELGYIEPLGIVSLINQIKNVFANGIFAPKIGIGTDSGNIILTLGPITIINKIICLAIIISLVGLFLLFLKRNYKQINKHRYLFLLIISFAFNFSLHLLYGNSEGILYILHYQFLLVLIISYLIKNTINNYKIIFGILILFLTFELMNNINAVIDMYHIISASCDSASQIPFAIIFIILPLSIIISKLNIAKVKKLIIIVISITIIISGYYLINKKVNPYSNLEDKYLYSLELYQSQLSDLKNKYNVVTTYNNKNKIYFFGMGNREKLLYVNGILINLRNNEVIKKYDIKSEIIIPSEYIVILNTKDDKKIEIYENEEGIYIKENKNIEAISEDKINLPTFEGYKYSEILKVLHQEILFNIDQSILKPNIIVYQNGWYRDAMMAAMVLDKTNNIDLIKTWVANIDNIYDEQNGQKEVDNLGELLYLTYITKSNNKIKKEILDEVKRIQIENNTQYISGYVDGIIRSYYPTAILKYSLELDDNEFKIEMPNFFDSYSTLSWFQKEEGIENKELENYLNDIQFPYLGWASFHTVSRGHLYICDNHIH